MYVSMYVGMYVCKYISMRNDDNCNIIKLHSFKHISDVAHKGTLKRLLLGLKFLCLSLKDKYRLKMCGNQVLRI